jgi:CheY-like chemotaxis protein
MRKKKILLVDDSEIYRDTARYMLEARGYEVVTLSSPFAFGAALTRERPDLALVDAFMPALQGDQLVRLARQNNLWDCPIVLHSDRSSRELLEMIETSGATGFLAKTNDADKLALAIEGFLKDEKPKEAPRKPSIPAISSAALIEPPSRRFGVAVPESRRPPPESFRPPPLDSYRSPRDSYLPPDSSQAPAAPDSRGRSPDSRRSAFPAPRRRGTLTPESRPAQAAEPQRAPAGVSARPPPRDGSGDD